MDKLTQDQLNGLPVAVLLEAGAALAKPIEGTGDRKYLVVPRDFEVKELDLEYTLARPRATNEHIVLGDALSFITYYQKFASDSTALFADLAKRQVKAVFDYHQANLPGWCRHSATLQLQWSTEWKPWTEYNKKLMEQEAFAEFIQLNLPDIVEPNGAELLEITQTLQAKKKVSFLSGQRLADGQNQLMYVEEVEGSAGPKGDLKIPEKIVLALRIFQGMERYRVEAFLRYRIGDDKKLRFFYQLERPERLVEDAFDQVKDQIKVGCSGPFFVTG